MKHDDKTGTVTTTIQEEAYYNKFFFYRSNLRDTTPRGYPGDRARIDRCSSPPTKEARTLTRARPSLIEPPCACHGGFTALIYRLAMKPLPFDDLVASGRWKGRGLSDYESAKTSSSPALPRCQ
jgi:hypothetical protein